MLVALALGAAGELRADPFETYGFTSRGAALGDAQTAAASRPAAAYDNPALLVDDGGHELLFGLSHHQAQLRVNGERLATDPLWLWNLGFATPLPFLPGLADRAAFGASVGLPASGLLLVREQDDQAVTFPRLDHRNQRLVAALGLAWRPLPWLRLGGGATLLPDVPGEVAVDIAREAGSSSLAIDIDYDWALGAGLAVDLPKDVRVALAWRQGQQIDLELPVDVAVTEGLPVLVRVSGPAFFTPERLTGGVAYRPIADLLVTADLQYLRYAAEPAESPTVELIDPQGNVTRRFPVEQPDSRSVLSPRVGAELWLQPWLCLRAGYAYLPTPTPPQEGRTNRLDGDRHAVALGLGLEVQPTATWLPRRLALDLHLQGQRMTPVAWEKQEILVGNPGYPTLTGEGRLLSAGLDLRIAP
ncbi:MAG: hypothetical protein RBU45_07940 [Myxococcota bacterium]|nr:hypothetical protein [Myxococcota bacterium]